MNSLCPWWNVDHLTKMTKTKGHRQLRLHNTYQLLSECSRNVRDTIYAALTLLTYKLWSEIQYIVLPLQHNDIVTKRSRWELLTGERWYDKWGFGKAGKNRLNHPVLLELLDCHAINKIYIGTNLYSHKGIGSILCMHVHCYGVFTYSVAL